MRPSIQHYFVPLLAMLLLSVQTGYAQEQLNHRLEYDHILLFVNDYAIKDSLDQIFTPAEKLTTAHTSQGTVGYYYLFYNTYIELLFLQDTNNAKANEDNFGSDYLSRWKQDGNHCALGFGMLMTPWDSSAVNGNYHKYVSSDALHGEYYLMSHYNNELSEPFIYVSHPSRAYEQLASLDDIDKKPEEIREDLRNYLTHPNGLRRISHILYSYAGDIPAEGNTKLLEASAFVDVVRSNATSLTLVFDRGTTGQKVLMLNDHIQLIIRY